MGEGGQWVINVQLLNSRYILHDERQTDNKSYLQLLVPSNVCTQPFHLHWIPSSLEQLASISSAYPAEWGNILLLTVPIPQFPSGCSPSSSSASFCWAAAGCGPLGTPLRSLKLPELQCIRAQDLQQQTPPPLEHDRPDRWSGRQSPRMLPIWGCVFSARRKFKCNLIESSSRPSDPSTYVPGYGGRHP